VLAIRASNSNGRAERLTLLTFRATVTKSSALKTELCRSKNGALPSETSECLRQKADPDGSSELVCSQEGYFCALSSGSVSEPYINLAQTVAIDVSIRHPADWSMSVVFDCISTALGRAHPQ
jgi:hypothetical protein